MSRDNFTNKGFNCTNTTMAKVEKASSNYSRFLKRPVFKCFPDLDLTYIVVQ